MQHPMVISLAFGILFITFVTLLLVLALYLPADTLVQSWIKLSYKYWPQAQEDFNE